MYERAGRILDREIMKPTEEVDNDLVNELEETILYCAEREKALLAEEALKK